MKLLWLVVLLFRTRSMIVNGDETGQNEKVQLRIGATHYPPVELIKFHPNGSIANVTGSFVAMYDWLAARLNMTYVLVLVNESDIEKKGVFTAALDDMINDKVDIAAISYVGTAERYKRMDFSFPFSIAEYGLLTPRPGEDSRIWAVLRPFQPMVWIMFGTTMIIMVSALSLYSWLYQRNQIKLRQDEKLTLPGQMSRYLVFVMANATNHAGGVPYNRHSFRVMVGAWLLITLVLVNSYASLLISALTVPKMKPVVDSFEDLVDSKQEGLTLAVNVDSVLGRFIMEAKSGIYKKLGDQLRAYPEGQFHTIAAQWERVNSKRFAVLDVDSFNYYVLGLDFKKNHNRNCNFRVSLPVPYVSFLTLALRKGGKHNQKISKEIMHLMETGIYNYWLIQDLVMRARECKKRIIPKAEKVPIKLKDTTSAFLVLGIGIALSGLVLLVELVRFIKLIRIKALMRN